MPTPAAQLSSQVSAAEPHDVFEEKDDVFLWVARFPGYVMQKVSATHDLQRHCHRMGALVSVVSNRCTVIKHAASRPVCLPSHLTRSALAVHVESLCGFPVHI